MSIPLVLCAPMVLAFEVSLVCAEFSGRAEAHPVEAVWLSGSELNRRTRSHDYLEQGDYAVLYWPDGQSVIRLTRGRCGSHTPCEGIDHAGKHWRLLKNPESC